LIDFSEEERIEAEKLKKSIRIEEQLRNINIEVIRYTHGRNVEVEHMFARIANSKPELEFARPELG